MEDGDRLTAVDAGLPGFARDLERQLALVDRRPADVEAVILTHSDSDHTGAAAKLREAGARVLIHARDDATLRKPGPKSGGRGRAPRARRAPAGGPQSAMTLPSGGSISRSAARRVSRARRRCP